MIEEQHAQEGELHKRTIRFEDGLVRLDWTTAADFSSSDRPLTVSELAGILAQHPRPDAEVVLGVPDTDGGTVRLDTATIMPSLVGSGIEDHDQLVLHPNAEDWATVERDITEVVAMLPASDIRTALGE